MIDRAAALDIARQRAAEKGWSLAEPDLIDETRADFGRRVKAYRIASNPRLRGARARFTIDAETGVILEEGYITR